MEMTMNPSDNAPSPRSADKPRSSALRRFFLVTTAIAGIGGAAFVLAPA
jgi:hypothetical protein